MEIDWDYWRRIHEAELWQFVALMAGLDPGQISTSDGDFFNVNASFDKYLSIALSHLGKSKPLKPLDHRYGFPGQEPYSIVEALTFWRWAASNDLPIPGPFREVAGKPPEPDWAMWRRMDAAPLWQLVALLARIDPRSMSLDRYENDRFEGANEDFEKFLPIATSCVAASLSVKSVAGRLPFSEVGLTDFLTWAVSKELPVPNELKELLRGGRTAGEATEPGGKRMKSLYKIVVGLAVRKYGYKGQIKKSEAAANIAQELDLAGVALDADTVRACLKQAWEGLEPSERPRTSD